MAPAPLTNGLHYADRYILKRRIGMGRLGEVWHADDTRLEMDVALKFFDQTEHRSMLEAVARKCMKITHPHIIRVYDFIDLDGRCALVMEYIEGGSLARKLKERDSGCYEPAQIQDWVKQLWDGLEELHELGIVHGNLNLANLGIAGTGELKILESGFFEVRAVALNPEMTFSFLPCLTPQILTGKRPSSMDDSYAAGACVYELLTGKPVFLGANILQQIQDREITPVALRRAELGCGTQPVPEDWEHWISRCLSKSPYDRPEVAAMSEQFKKAAPVSTLTQEEATAEKTRSTSASVRIAQAKSKLSSLSKNTWIGIGAAAALVAFFFISWQPAQKALQVMEAAFDQISIEKISVPPAEKVKLWQDFMSTYARPISYTDRDAEMLREAITAQMTQQQAADEERRLAQAEADRQKRELDSKLDDLKSELTRKAASTESTMDKDRPAGENLKEWESLSLLYQERIKDFKDSAALPTGLKELGKSFQEQISKWTGEKGLQEVEYKDYKDTISRETDRLIILFADGTKGAAFKQTEIEKALEGLGEPPLSQEDSHTSMISQLKTWSKDWAAKALAEAPAMPLALKDLFAGSQFASLPEEKLKPLLAKVYTSFDIDPKTDPERKELHKAILAKQTTAGGITDGKLNIDDFTKAEIPAVATVEEASKFITSLIPSATKSSGGGGSRRKKTVPPPTMLDKVKNLFRGGSKK